LKGLSSQKLSDLNSLIEIKIWNDN
jgi:hypothetical protein